MDETKIENSIKEKLNRYPNALLVFETLINDSEVKELLEITNDVSIKKLNFNDHGRIHAKIAVDSSLKLLNLLVKEPKEESVIAIVFAAYLHDIGVSINRENHELFSVILAKPLIERIYSSLKSKTKALEAILCHMANYKPHSIEAGIVSIADGTDMTAGRARIVSKIKKTTGRIHSFSALEILNVEIKKGKKKPVEIEIIMKNTAGIFQVEEILLPKLKNSGLIDKVSIVAVIKKDKKTEKIVVV